MTTTTVSQACLDEIIAKHVLWLTKKSTGAQAVFTKCDLSGLDFQDLDLRATLFTDCNLRSVSFDYLTLTDAEFNNCDMRNAGFFKSVCINTNFSNSNMRATELDRSDLRSANFSNVNFRKATVRGSNMSDANMLGADVSDADFFRVNLHDATLTDVDFSTSNIHNTIGNGKEIKTLQTEKYLINFIKGHIQIGCRNYTVEEWAGFSDRKINTMDVGAAAWWKKNKEYVMLSYKQLVK